MERKGGKKKRGPPPETKQSLPLRPGALFRLRRGLGALPPGQEEPREQKDVGGDQGREREAQAAPGEVERFPHLLLLRSGFGERKGKKQRRGAELMLLEGCFFFVASLKLESRVGKSRDSKSYPWRSQAARAGERWDGVERERERETEREMGGALADYCEQVIDASIVREARIVLCSPLFSSPFFSFLSLPRLGCRIPRIQIQAPRRMSAAAVDRALYALAPPGGGTVLPPAVSAALPRALLAVALVLVSAWVLGPLGGLGSQPRVVSEK